MHACSLIEKSVPAVLLVLNRVSRVSARVSNHTDGLFFCVIMQQSSPKVHTSDVLNEYFTQCVL